MTKLSPWIVFPIRSGRVLLSALCLAFIPVGLCSAQLPEPTVPMLFTKQWSGANGFPSNEITSSVQAQSGFLWITSYHGLIRFDGSNVDLFGQQNIPFLKTSSFQRAYEDKQGTLWFVSNSNGIVQFKNNSFHSFPATPDKRLTSVHCLLVREDSSVWVGTMNEGLFLVRGNTIQSIGDSLLRNFAILDIAADTRNNLWIATDGNGLVKYDGLTMKQFTIADGLQSNYVTTLAVTRKGDIVVGTTNGLDMISRDRITSYKPLEEMQINSVKIDSRERMWIGTETGLARIFPDENRFEFATKANGFPFAQINAVNFGSAGSVWLSTAKSGLIQIEDRGISHYTIGRNLPLSDVNTLGFGPGQSILIGSGDGEFFGFSEGQFKPIALKAKLSNTVINDIFTEADGTLWVATQRGILQIDPMKKESWLTTRDGLPTNDIHRIAKDPLGNMWFATRSQGVVKFRNGRRVALFNTSNGLDSNYPLALETDFRGNVYVGTNGGGMTILHDNGKMETKHIRQNDDGLLIFSIHKNKDEHIWLTTNFGLYHFDGVNFKSILLKTSLPGASFYDWIEDNNENMWVTSNAGVMSMRKKDVLQQVAGKIVRVENRIFDSKDGIIKECTAAKSLVSSSGLWIPSLGGIIVINPNHIIRDERAPLVYMQSLKTDELIFTPDSPITVKPGNNRYTMNFTAPSVASPARIQFKYKLDNVDRFWVSAGAKHQVEYTNLSPGTYTFHVMASVDGNAWSAKPARITFAVLPFFYQTDWFMALMIAQVALLLFGIYKWRVRLIEQANRELRKVNGELDRFVYSASHDLRSPLSSILGLTALARVEEPDLVYNYIAKIENCVKQLDQLIRDITDFSSNARAKRLTEQIDFHSLVEESIKKHQYVNAFSEFRWKVTIKASQPFYSDPKRLKIILGNLISNSLKYRNPLSNEPFVAIDILSQNSVCDISVSDNGIGISKSHIGNIFDMFYRAHANSQGSGLGLYIVKETISKLKGKITVYSEPGVGSTFKIELPSLKSSQHKVGFPWKKWPALRPQKREFSSEVPA